MAKGMMAKGVTAKGQSCHLTSPTATPLPPYLVDYGSQNLSMAGDAKSVVTVTVCTEGGLEGTKVHL